MIQYKQILITLALLLTAVTGAWAQTVTVTWTLTDLQANPDVTTFTKDGVTLKCDTRMTGGKSFVGPVTFSNTLGNFTKIEITGSNSSVIKSDIFTNDGNTATWTGNAASISTPASITYATQFVFTIAPTEPPLTVAWNASTKTGSFEMPAYDVEIAPIYAPTAQWAKVENVDQLPTAAEGIFAESTDAIVKAGTVAKIGETENLQGTLMYAVGTSATEQPALTAFSATLPTAKDITTAGDVYVWYYIKGADAPQGQTATAENTFNDSEICATPLKVTVLNNKFDIQFKAANANTIEASKATVTVGGTAATVTEGKLEGVKMGSEVKVTAKEGYKFRKVEVKKKEAPAAPITVTWNNDDITGIGKSFTKDGVTLTAGNIDFGEKNFLNGGTFTTTLGNFTKIEVTTGLWYASGTGWSGGTWTGNASSVSFSGDIYGMGYTKFVFTIEPTN